MRRAIEGEQVMSSPLMGVAIPIFLLLLDWAVQFSGYQIASILRKGMEFHYRFGPFWRVVLLALAILGAEVAVFLPGQPGDVMASGTALVLGTWWFATWALAMTAKLPPA